LPLAVRKRAAQLCVERKPGRLRIDARDVVGGAAVEVEAELRDRALLVDEIARTQVDEIKPVSSHDVIRWLAEAPSRPQPTNRWQSTKPVNS